MGFCECGALVAPNTSCGNCARLKSLEAALGQPEETRQPQEASETIELQDKIAGLIFKMYGATKAILFPAKTYRTVVDRVRTVRVPVPDVLPAPSLNKPLAERRYALDGNNVVSERSVSFARWAGSLCYLIQVDENFGYRMGALLPEEREQLKNAMGQLYDVSRNYSGAPARLVMALRRAEGKTERFAAHPQERVIGNVGGNKPRAVKAEEERKWGRLQRPFMEKRY